MAPAMVRKSPKRWLTIWQFVAHVGLCAAVLTWGFVSVDRSQILLRKLRLIGAVSYSSYWTTDIDYRAMRQASFEDASYWDRTKKTRKQRFLTQMNTVLPWEAMLDLIRPWRMRCTTTWRCAFSHVWTLAKRPMRRRFASFVIYWSSTG